MIYKYETIKEITSLFIKNPEGDLKEILVDTEDLEKIVRFKNSWYISSNRNGTVNYVVSNTPRPNRTRVYLHRFIMDAPKGSIVDHINHNTYDNRKQNLRVVNESINQMNRKGANSNSTTGVRGVSFDKRFNRYYARAYAAGKNIFIGCFESKRDAEKAAINFWKEKQNEIRRN